MFSMLAGHYYEYEYVNISSLLSDFNNIFHLQMLRRKASLMPTIQPSRRWEWCGPMAHGDCSFTFAWRKWKRSLSATSFLYNRVMEPPTWIVDDTVDGRIPAPPGIYIYIYAHPPPRADPRASKSTCFCNKTHPFE